MNKYSQIDRIIIKDFRSIQDMQIDFSESPIVALVGDNDAGKTSAIKAFEVCALHHNPRGQKGYIRTGAPYFGVVIMLADGTSVIRMKTADGINRYEVRYPDGTSWNTTKISEGLPVQVSEVMGMIEEPETKEYLQVRSYEDQLLLVYTPASTNYKVMYDALKVGQITRAVRKGTDESNMLRQKMIDNSNSIRALEKNMSKIAVLDITSALEMREAVRATKDKLLKIEDALKTKESIDKTNEQLGVLRLLDTFKLEAINELQASLLNSANSTYKSMKEANNMLSSLSDLDSIEQINVGTIEKLVSAVENMHALSRYASEKKVYDSLNSTQEINETTLIKMESAIEAKRQLMECNSELEKYTGVQDLGTLDISTTTTLKRLVELKESKKSLLAQIEEAKQSISTMTQKLKESGARVETCPNCGTDIVVENM